MKKWKLPNCPLIFGMDKQNMVCFCVHTHHGILFSPKKNEVLICATAWVKLENIRLSEICQTQKDKYCMILPI